MTYRNSTFYNWFKENYVRYSEENVILKRLRNIIIN